MTRRPPNGLLLLLVLLLVGGSPGNAQIPPPAAGTVSVPVLAEAGAPADSTLRGILLLGGEPADTGTVILHRVDPSEAGAVDSTRVGADGGFTFELPGPPVPGSGEIYFVSARYEGILYFGAPVTEPSQLDSLYTVDTHHTRAAQPGGMPFTVSVRNLFIDEGPLGWRVTDVFEIRNDSVVTWISGGENEPVWTHPLPPGARSFRVGQSDLPEDAVRFADGVVQVYAPVPPGDRLYVLQYEVESIEFSLPLPGTTELVEILVEEPAPELVMEGLTREPPLQFEAGTTYLRWSGQGFADGSVTIRRGREGGPDPLPWLGVGLALALLLLAVWLVRRPAGVTEGAGSDAYDGNGRASGRPVGRAELLLAVARLDEAFEALEAPEPEQESAYRAERAELLARLRSPRDDAPSGDRG